MAGKDPDEADRAKALLDHAHLRLAERAYAAVEAFGPEAEDAKHVSGEKRAKHLVALARVVSSVRQSAPKSDKPPAPPANENDPMVDTADELDDCDGLSGEALRAEVGRRLERAVQYFEQKRLAGGGGPADLASGLPELALGGGSGPARRSG